MRHSSSLASPRLTVESWTTRVRFVPVCVPCRTWIFFGSFVVATKSLVEPSILLIAETTQYEQHPILWNGISIWNLETREETGKLTEWQRWDSTPAHPIVIEVDPSMCSLLGRPRPLQGRRLNYRRALSLWTPLAGRRGRTMSCRGWRWTTCQDQRRKREQR